MADAKAPAVVKPAAPATAPPATSATHVGTASSRQAGSQPASSDVKFGFLKLAGMEHVLKLRTNVQLSDRVSAELGADYNFTSKLVLPVGILQYELVRKGQQLGHLRLTTNRAQWRKGIAYDSRWVSCRLWASAGFNYTGKPEFGLDIDEIKPVGLVLAAAAVLLALGKPLSGNKSFGALRFGVSGEGSPVMRAETRATVTRAGNGLQLALNQVNAVLRL